MPSVLLYYKSLQVLMNRSLSRQRSDCSSLLYMTKQEHW